MEHAERNAIYNAARAGTPRKAARIYVEIMPCMDCARAIVQAGIGEVVVSDRAHERGTPANTTTSISAMVEVLFERSRRASPPRAGNRRRMTGVH